MLALLLQNNVLDSLSKLDQWSFNEKDVKSDPRSMACSYKNASFPTLRLITLYLRNRIANKWIMHLSFVILFCFIFSFSKSFFLFFIQQQVGPPGPPWGLGPPKCFGIVVASVQPWVYRKTTNLACGGTFFSTTPYSPNPLTNFFTWNNFGYLGAIQMAPPWRFLSFHF